LKAQGDRVGSVGRERMVPNRPTLPLSQFSAPCGFETLRAAGFQKSLISGTFCLELCTVDDRDIVK
jgi:hypothetical protein